MSNSSISTSPSSSELDLRGQDSTTFLTGFLSRGDSAPPRDPAQKSARPRSFFVGQPVTSERKDTPKMSKLPIESLERTPDISYRSDGAVNDIDEKPSAPPRTARGGATAQQQQHIHGKENAHIPKVQLGALSRISPENWSRTGEPHTVNLLPHTESSFSSSSDDVPLITSQIAAHSFLDSTPSIFPKPPVFEPGSDGIELDRMLGRGSFVSGTQSWKSICIDSTEHSLVYELFQTSSQEDNNYYSESPDEIEDEAPVAVEVIKMILPPSALTRCDAEWTDANKERIQKAIKSSANRISGSVTLLGASPLPLLYVSNSCGGAEGFTLSVSNRQLLFPPSVDSINRILLPMAPLSEASVSLLDIAALCRSEDGLRNRICTLSYEAGGNSVQLSCAEISLTVLVVALAAERLDAPHGNLSASNVFFSLPNLDSCDVEIVLTDRGHDCFSTLWTDVSHFSQRRLAWLNTALMHVFNSSPMSISVREKEFALHLLEKPYEVSIFDDIAACGACAYLLLVGHPYRHGMSALQAAALAMEGRGSRDKSNKDLLYLKVKENKFIVSCLNLEAIGASSDPQYRSLQLALTIAYERRKERIGGDLLANTYYFAYMCLAMNFIYRCLCLGHPDDVGALARAACVSLRDVLVHPFLKCSTDEDPAAAVAAAACHDGRVNVQELLEALAHYTITSEQQEISHSALTQTELMRLKLLVDETHSARETFSRDAGTGPLQTRYYRNLFFNDSSRLYTLLADKFNRENVFYSRESKKENTTEKSLTLIQRAELVMNCTSVFSSLQVHENEVGSTCLLKPLSEFKGKDLLNLPSCISLDVITGTLIIEDAVGLEINLTEETLQALAIRTIAGLSAGNGIPKSREEEIRGFMKHFARSIGSHSQADYGVFGAPYCSFIQNLVVRNCASLTLTVLAPLDILVVSQVKKSKLFFGPCVTALVEDVFECFPIALIARVLYVEGDIEECALCLHLTSDLRSTSVDLAAYLQRATSENPVGDALAALAASRASGTPRTPRGSPLRRATPGGTSMGSRSSCSGTGVDADILCGDDRLLAVQFFPYCVSYPDLARHCELLNIVPESSVTLLEYPGLDLSSCRAIREFTAGCAIRTRWAAIADYYTRLCNKKVSLECEVSDAAGNASVKITSNIKVSINDYQLSPVMAYERYCFATAPAPDYPFMRSLLHRMEFRHGGTDADLTIYPGELQNWSVELYDIHGGGLDGERSAKKISETKPARALSCREAAQNAISKWSAQLPWDMAETAFEGESFARSVISKRQPSIILLECLEAVSVRNVSRATIVVAAAEVGLTLYNVTDCRIYAVCGESLTVGAGCANLEICAYVRSQACEIHPSATQITLTPLVLEAPSLDTLLERTRIAQRSVEGLQLSENMLLPTDTQDSKNVKYCPLKIVRLSVPALAEPSQFMREALCPHGGRSSVIESPPAGQTGVFLFHSLIGGNVLRMEDALSPLSRQLSFEGSALQLSHLNACNVHIADAVQLLIITQCRGMMEVAVAAAQFVLVDSCVDLTLHTACQKITIRNSHHCDFALHTNTSPVVDEGYVGVASGAVRPSSFLQFRALNLECRRFSRLLSRAGINPNDNYYNKAKYKSEAPVLALEPIVRPARFCGAVDSLRAVSLKAVRDRLASCVATATVGNEHAMEGGLAVTPEILFDHISHVNYTTQHTGETNYSQYLVAVPPESYFNRSALNRVLESPGRPIASRASFSRALLVGPPGVPLVIGNVPDRTGKLKDDGNSSQVSEKMNRALDESQRLFAAANAEIVRLRCLLEVNWMIAQKESKLNPVKNAMSMEGEAQTASAAELQQYETVAKNLQRVMRDNTRCFEEFERLALLIVKNSVNKSLGLPPLNELDGIMAFRYTAETPSEHLLETLFSKQRNESDSVDLIKERAHQKTKEISERNRFSELKKEAIDKVDDIHELKNLGLHKYNLRDLDEQTIRANLATLLRSNAFLKKQLKIEEEKVKERMKRLL